MKTFPPDQDSECPGCHAQVDRGVDVCPSCGLEFDDCDRDPTEELERVEDR